ncbi:type IV secretion system protein VirB10 [Phenylobacterium sp.]|jgi:type IV secretion system protein VirB10|uniref:type IV secretion system protein VirB10 n=1 Tax=Phenylobacterium sp. TaxID=1871053 RepID=UPI003563F4C1
MSDLDAGRLADAPKVDTQPAGDRAISPVAGRFGNGRAGKVVALAALVVGCGVFAAATMHPARSRPAKAPDQPARQVVAFEPLKPPTLAAPGPGAPSLTTPPAPGADPGQVPALQPGQAPPPGSPVDAASKARADLAAVRSAPLIAYSHEGGGLAGLPGSSATVPAIETAAAGAATELDQLRHGSTIGQARATRLPNRNFLIVAGSAIPCLLQTAMDTATPGYVSCLIPRDVLSDTGGVVLLEKGTKVLGEYRSTLRQGQKRLFVLWTRAVTPAGVAIRLESPAADALGRAGFDGELDTHFWDRFGGALLLSIVNDGTYALAGNGGASNTARVPSDAAAVALQNSINIPPSLRKGQGAEVTIFVAQDFDFSSVYGLQAR